MPIYEYECPLCGVFETMQKASDKPLKAQPDCPHAKCPRSAKRLISPAAFHLKGGGWYKTDYASSGSPGTAAKSEKPSTEDAKPAKADTTEKKSLAKVKGGCGSGCGCH